MMARLASDTWSQSDGVISTNALFIERDGERFRYCLDYMRDGGIVHLPPTVPKAALLQDLEYYGFQHVDESKISMRGSMSMFKTCFKHIDSIKMDLKYFELIEYCICLYQQNAKLEFEIPRINNTGEKDEKHKRLFDTASKLITYERSSEERSSETTINQNQFNSCLERFGLKLKECVRSNTYNGFCSINLDYL
eukprot:CAMPEP_0194156398 /NCGR_PEP_ID=MMETSP0152-20130528/68194_1 /TAXON_ID=1049557 /ORGANISM="Thalassiothrix antarctica, Strain L6-D1" /LENGTH=193 /DNA_ID=CAMNT_0038864045 /DNA_START=188 /DNA_END=769 /DNA_ORIENTATION=-